MRGLTRTLVLAVGLTVKAITAAAPIAGILLVIAGGQAPARPDPEAAPFAPRHYVCYRADRPLTIDGRLDEPAWRAAPWTEAFTDIQGDARPRPRFLTRAKMLWDDRAFYVAADLEEPDLWATLKERDSIVFQDNDFEIFIDPDGDTHAYYELEVNAFGTVWDLMLIKPYRDGGPAIGAWNIAGLRTGLDLRGTINRPGDRDTGWTVEIAMPWRSLVEAAPGKRPPSPGQQWRVNFSRVQWGHSAGEAGYEKRRDPATGNVLPEDNWVWSPQGAVDMHMPERWGSVQFSAGLPGERDERFVLDPNEAVRWALRRLYYRQRAYRDANGRYARDLAALDAARIRLPGAEFRPTLEATDSLYEIHAPGAPGTTVHIRDDGRTWTRMR